MIPQIAIQKEYFDAISEQMKEIRGIKHDMRHFIGVIKSLADEGRYEDLKQFLDEYSEKSKTESIPQYCENVVANAILGYYTFKAMEAGIPFQCACRIPKQLSMIDTDLCIILGNALENAIEACSNTDRPDIQFISIEARVLDNHLLIKIQNSYSGRVSFHDGHSRSWRRFPVRQEAEKACSDRFTEVLNDDDCL